MQAPRQLFAFHDQVRRHAVLSIAAIVLVLGVCGWLSSRARVDDNMASLLPAGPDSPGEAARLLSDFGALDTLLIDFSLPGATLDGLTAAGDALVARLVATGLFERVQAGPRADELRKLAGIVLPRRLMLLEDPRAELEARLQPERLRASLQDVKEQLSSPAAIALKGQLLADPLGLDNEVLSGLGNVGGRVRLENGHLVSEDGAHLLLIGVPKRRALDVDASAALMVELARVRDALRQESGGRAFLSWSGGPRFASESASLIRSDIASNFVWSTLIMLVVFGVRFRGMRLLALASVPLVIGVAGATAALAAVQGHIHGLTLGFGSALVGIAMDYPLHLINKAAAEPGDRAAAYASTTRTVFQGLCLGFTTTLMGFMALFLSDFPGLVELAWFSCIGLVLAFASTLALVPPLCTLLGPKAPTPSGLAVRLMGFSLSPRAAFWATAATLLLGGLAARGLVFDGDLRKLDSQNPATMAEHLRIMNLFGQPGDSSLAVVRGRTAQEALRANDQLSLSLRKLVSDRVLTSASGIAHLVPAAETQRQRAKALQGFDLAGQRERFGAVAVEAGFSAEAFNGFWDEVAKVQRGEVAPLEPQHLEGTFLSLLVSRALHCSASGCDVATPLERSVEVSLASLRAAWPKGARLIDSEALAAETVARIPEQLAMLCAVGVVANILFLWLVYRSLRNAVLACLPCAIALVATVGLMALLGVPMNMVSGGGLVLVFGCGVDYGVFSLEGLAEAEPDGVEQLGVLLAAFTTLAGFGTLALAQNGAMRALGFSTGVGTAVSAVVALVLLPGLASRWIHRAEHKPPAAVAAP